MGKLVRTVGSALLAVAGVALAPITGGTSLLATKIGLSSLAAGALSVALTVGASLLAPRAKPPRNSEENVNRLRANIDPRTPRKTVIGETAMAVDIR